MLVLSSLEMDITQACNLHCDGCAHYSDYGLRGHVDLGEATGWLESLAAKVTPTTFALLGGEPLLHPQVAGMVSLAHKVWPQSERRLITNGLLLPRHDDLLGVLEQTGTAMEISLHSLTDRAYLDRLTAVMEWMADAVKRHPRLRASVRESQSLFYRTYRGRGRAMLPWDEGNPRRSWEVCANKSCVTIHRGRLWKCPPIAFLGLVADKVGLRQSPAWAPYLAYEGIPVQAGEAELGAFLRRQDEPICAMCPTRLDPKPLGIVTKAHRDED